MKNMRLTRQVLLAILGAWAVVFRLLDFPLLPSAPFLKFDFSDVPVFIGLLINGPIGAAVVAFIRDFIEYLRKGGEAGIPLGVSMSFIGTMTMMLILHFYGHELAQLFHCASYLCRGHALANQKYDRNGLSSHCAI